MNSSTEQLTLFAEDSRSCASRSALRGNALDPMTPAISGRILLGLLRKSDPVTASLRTFLASSRWASTLFSLTWKVSATPAGRLLFRLVPSTPSTGAIGFGSWPTPNVASMNNRQEYPTAGGDGLQTAVRRQAGTLLPTEKVPNLWPTPRHEGFDAGGHRGTTDSLHSAVKAWATPRTSMIENNQTTVSPSHRNGTHGWNVAAQIADTMGGEIPNGQKLHGRWTLALMGLPPDWCDDLPPDPLGTIPT